MEKSIHLILHNIRSLYNIGSMFRSADAFGVEKIYLSGYSAYPPGRQMRKISKTALGAQDCVSWEYVHSIFGLMKILREKRISLVALENNTKNISTVHLSKFIPKYPLALVIGNEVRGISTGILQKCDACVEIPMRGKKESLNVSVAVSIALYELNKKRLSK